MNCGLYSGHLGPQGANGETDLKMVGFFVLIRVEINNFFSMTVRRDVEDSDEENKEVGSGSGSAGVYLN
jgi:hypothetical protein